LPFNSSGVWTNAPGAEQPDPPTPASLSAFRAYIDDVADGLTQTLKVIGDEVDAGGARVTNVADATGSNDAVTYGQMTALLTGIPIGCVLPFAGQTLPSSDWLFCYGQAISRTTYADLFDAIGTIHGAGNGSTTFNLPDLRGRVVAGQDDMGGSSANRLTGFAGGVNGDTLGASGGDEKHVLTTAQLSTHTHAGTTGAGGAHTHFIANADTVSGAAVTAATQAAFERNSGSSADYTLQGSATNATLGKTSTSATHTHTLTTAAAGSDEAHNNVQPTLVLNYIIRAL